MSVGPIKYNAQNHKIADKFGAKKSIKSDPVEELPASTRSAHAGKDQNASAQKSQGRKSVA